MLSSRLTIGQQNKPLLTNHNCETVHTISVGGFSLNGPLCFYISIVEPTALQHISFIHFFFNHQKSLKSKKGLNKGFKEDGCVVVLLFGLCKFEHLKRVFPVLFARIKALLVTS